MKTLNTIQTLSKLGKVFSTIIYVCSIVGAAFCAAGIVSLRFLPESFKIGGTTIHGLIEASDKLSLQDCYAFMTAGLIVCVGEAVLCKIAQCYFKNELAAGTPFTLAGAKELLRFGICAVCIHGFTEAFDPDLGSSASAAIGVMLIIMSLLCRHGAEQAQKEETTEEPAQ